MEKQIDLNLNIAEAYGYGRDFLERELLPYASSVNVATGAHTGDPAQIEKALKNCKNFTNLGIGALISYPDILGFGFRKIQLKPEELRASILAQLGALSALAKVNDFEISHVRAHGALYQDLGTNYSVAETVAKTIQEFSQWLVLVGPSGQVLQEISSWTNVRVAPEARFDLRYRNETLRFCEYKAEKDETLDINNCAEKLRKLINESKVKTEDKQEVEIKFETIHIPASRGNCLEAAKLAHGMIDKLAPIKSFDYEPYLSEFI